MRWMVPLDTRARLKGLTGPPNFRPSHAGQSPTKLARYHK